MLGVEHDFARQNEKKLFAHVSLYLRKFLDRAGADLRKERCEFLLGKSSTKHLVLIMRRLKNDASPLSVMAIRPAADGRVGLPPKAR